MQSKITSKIEVKKRVVEQKGITRNEEMCLNT